MSQQDKRPPYDPQVVRAAPPEIIFPKDMAVILYLSETEAKDAIQSGQCGPYVTICGKVAVLRESFLAFLEKSSHAPGPRAIEPQEPER